MKVELVRIDGSRIDMVMSDSSIHAIAAGFLIEHDGVEYITGKKVVINKSGSSVYDYLRIYVETIEENRKRFKEEISKPLQWRGVINDIE